MKLKRAEIEKHCHSRMGVTHKGKHYLCYEDVPVEEHRVSFYDQCKTVIYANGRR